MCHRRWPSRTVKGRFWSWRWVRERWSLSTSFVPGPPGCAQSSFLYLFLTAAVSWGFKDFSSLCLSCACHRRRNPWCRVPHIISHEGHRSLTSPDMTSVCGKDVHNTAASLQAFETKLFLVGPGKWLRRSWRGVAFGCPRTSVHSDSVSTEVTPDPHWNEKESRASVFICDRKEADLGMEILSGTALVTLGPSLQSPGDVLYLPSCGQSGAGSLMWLPVTMPWSP